jgi:vitamin B12 transporter
MSTWLRLRSRQWARSIAMGAIAALPAFTAGAEPPVDEAEPLPFVGEAVVVGQRPRQLVIGDPTGAGTIVSADQFEGEVKGVAQLIATAPGVAVDDYGGLGQLATASIRGSTAAGVLVLLDGLPLNTAFGGAVDLSSIPRYWIDRIEIVRGAEGAHFGAGSLGGVVNVVTRRPPPGSWSAEGTAGSFGTWAGAADGAIALGPATLLLSGGGETTGGAFPYKWDPTPSDADPTRIESHRANNAAWRTGAMAKLALPVREARLDAVAQLSAGRRELPGWPYALTPHDWQEDGRAVLGASYSTPTALRGLVLAGRVSGRFDWLDARVGTSLPSQRSTAAGLSLEGRLAHAAGSLRIAAEAEGEETRADGITANPVRANLAMAASEDFLLFADRLRIAPALRVERSGTFDGLSAKLGASWLLAAPLTLRASAGRTFRAPSEAELHLQQGLVQPNPDLAPEIGMGGDGALVLNTGPVFASVGAHATLYRDLIYYQRVSMGRLRPFNAGKALVRGLEIELGSAPIRKLLGLSLSASYTYLQTEILRGMEGTLGNALPHRARHRLYARAALSPGPVDAHVEAHYVGAQWTDDRNLMPIPAALVWNTGVALWLRRDPAIRLALELRNARDDRTLQDGFGNPLPGRTVFVTASAGSPAGKGSP